MKTAILAAALVLLAACGDEQAELEDAVVADGVAVAEAWTRPTPPGRAEAAIYVTIENRQIYGLKGGETYHFAFIPEDEARNVAPADFDPRVDGIHMPPLALAKVKDGAHIGVINRGGGFCFTQEPFDDPRITALSNRGSLQGHTTIQFFVFR